MRREFVAVPIDLFDGAARQDRDAVLFHLGADVRANIMVEAAQDIIAAIDQGDIAAEPGKDAGELESDISAALDHDALRQLREMKHLVGGDDVLDAGNGASVVGRAAGCDQHVLRGDRLASR